MKIWDVDQAHTPERPTTSRCQAHVYGEPPYNGNKKV
jgi:hypothetical protein